MISLTTEDLLLLYRMQPYVQANIQAIVERFYENITIEISRFVPVLANDATSELRSPGKSGISLKW